MPATLVSAASARQRLVRAAAWLAAQPRDAEILVVAASFDAAHELLRELAASRGAAFGWHRRSLARLAADLAAESLARDDAVPIGPAAAEAVVARVLHEQRASGLAKRLAHCADGPGLARALALVLGELRHARVDAATLEKEAPWLGAANDAYARALHDAGLADRAAVFGRAAERTANPAPHALLDLPTLLLDLAVESPVEAALLRGLAARAPRLFASVPRGDATSERWLRDALGCELEPLHDAAAPPTALRRLQRHLFEQSAPAEAAPGAEVEVLSAPGESRECVEIARRILQLARDGVAFDRIAILLRAPEEYRPHLVEALRRAGVPAHFARGAVHPDPAGRAFAALLACAAEGLSARRFAEYLSLGELPDATPAGAPPPPLDAQQRWVAPDEELISDRMAAALQSEVTAEPEAWEHGPVSESAPVAAGSLRAPRHWEALLVDAAVIGGRERWARRIDGLARELALDLDALEDPEDAGAEHIRRSQAELANLRAYALPLIDALAALPASACWGVWLDALGALATRALRRPARVLATLAELAPMHAVGPVALAEVQLVLARRLLELRVPPSGRRYGRVFVAPTELARGLCFDVVFVPGLAEKLFPRKIQEEPLLLDALRARVSPDLPRNEQRVARERLALRLAVGASDARLVLSYPRLDLDQSRPRVASFYALEALRAAEGRLPGFDALAERAETRSAARVGWPAPARAEEAIDAAEHDLALLESLLDQDPERSVGTARYLLEVNPHLARALRFRARRWLTSWTQADGLIPAPRAALSPAAREAIEAHALSARSFSATALQHFAACPYRFFLYAVHKLAPREVPQAIESLDPLQRGSLVHDVQFASFERLRDADALPVRPENLAQARETLDAVLDEVAARYHDALAPAIERVWQDAVEAVRADLREWLRRAAEDRSGFAPWSFELSFGLASRRARDPHSREAPVALDCGIALRGAIDLLERSDDGRIRATDHKTGAVRVQPGQIVAGGAMLQPVLYALAAEQLFPEARVESGRLYYCTAAGGFAERVVPLDARAREAAGVVAEVVGAALAEPFLPAAPARDACRYCDYRPVCGPYEELRTARKWQAPLAPLARLRSLP
jgi:ATP-dependent helicase/nuclease subunit B